MASAGSLPSGVGTIASNDPLAISMSASVKPAKYFFQFLPNPKRDIALLYSTSGTARAAQPAGLWRQSVGSGVNKSASAPRRRSRWVCPVPVRISRSLPGPATIITRPAIVQQHAGAVRLSRPPTAPSPQLSVWCSGGAPPSVHSACCGPPPRAAHHHAGVLEAGGATGSVAADAPAVNVADTLMRTACRF